VIPALVILYILLIGLAAGCSLWSFRLRLGYGLAFLRTFHLFVLVSLAYAVMSYIGEVFAPAITAGPVESRIRFYMIIDLVTIPLLGTLFFLLFSWIARLLDRRPPTALKALFYGVEGLFLSAFVIAFITYFGSGITTLTYLAVLILDGIVGTLLVAAVLVLLFVPPSGDDSNRRRLARGLGVAYAVWVAVFVAVLAAPRAALVPRAEIAAAIPAMILFLFNVPALFYLSRSLRLRPPRPDPTTPEGRGLAVLTRDAGITEREQEIIRLVAAGLGNREVGKRLFISPKTVKNHMTNIYEKTGVRNRVQLANLLRRPGDSPGSEPGSGPRG
jgi:DNA-binding CsgD family transcriptional regulator